MKIVLDCCDDNIILNDDKIAVLEIFNKKLFSKVCQSFVSGEMENAVIPYLIHDDSNKKLSVKNYDIVFNLFELPWEDRQTLKILYEKFNALMMEDDKLRQEIEELQVSLNSKLEILSYSLDTDFCYNNSWSLQKYFAMLKFVPEIDKKDLLLDNLTKFLNFRKDIGINKLLIFVNLKNFLNKNDVVLLYKHIIFSKIPVFLLENAKDSNIIDHESKYIIDQDFMEEKH